MIRTSCNSDPFFSVIICTYNRSALIQRALTSLFAQTEQDWEAIIVDDGSDDNTFMNIELLISGKDNVKYIRQSHRGISFARNTGIILSSGRYLTFLDSDDEYAPDHLKLRKGILLSFPGTDLLHGGIKIIGDEYVPDRDDPTRLIPVRECVVGGTFFFRKQNAEKLGGFDNLAYADDTSFFDKHVEAGLDIRRTDHGTYIYYRDTPDSLCNMIRDRS